MKSSKCSQTPKGTRSRLLKKHLSARPLPTLLLALALVPSGQAATCTWLGTTNTALSGTATNWGGGIPGGTDTAAWLSATYANQASANADMTLGQMWFCATTGTVTFGSGTSTLTLNGVSSSGTNIGIQLDAGGAAVTTGSAKFALGADQTWLNNSANAFTVPGTITNSSNSIARTLTVDGSGVTSLNGIIKDNSTGTVALVKTGTGTLNLGVANTFSGGLTIKQGIVTTSVTQGFGGGTITLGDTSGSSNATLLQPGAGIGLTYNNNIVVAAGSSGTLVISSSGSITYSGSVALNHDLTLGAVNAGRILAFAGTMTGSNTLNIIGQNTYSRVSISGGNGSSFTGNVVINSPGGITFANHGLGDGSATITLTNGILEFAAGNTQDVGSRLRTNGSTALQLAMGGNAVVFGSPLTDASLTKGLTVAGGGSLTLTGANTYTGTTTVGTTSNAFGSASSVGLLKLAVGASILSGNALTTGTGGTFDLNGNSQTLGLLTNAGVVTNSGTGTPTLTIGNGSTGAGTLSGTMNVVWNQGATSSTISGTIANVGNLTLNGTGAGTMTLSGSNSFSGGATLSAGKLLLGNTNALSTGLFTVTSGTVTSSGSTAFIVPNPLSFAGNSSLGDTSTSYNGPLTFNGDGDLSGGMRSLTVNSPVTLAGAISNGGLTKLGASTLTLSGSSTFAGGVVLSAGRIQIANANALGSGTATLATGTFSSSDTASYVVTNPVAVTGTVSLGDLTNSGTLTFSGPVDLTSGTRTLSVITPVTISGAIANGALIKTGTGILVLTGTSTYSGLTTGSTGVLQLGDGFAGHDGALSTSGILNSTQVRFNLFGDQTVGYPITGNGSLWKQGPGTLTLTGSNTPSAVTVFDSALQLGDGTVGHDGSVTASSGVTDNGSLIYNLFGSQSAGYVISGSGSVSKSGAGTLTLTGSNSYSGGTTINAGVLSVAALVDSGSCNIGTTGTITLGGGTLQFTGASGSTSRPVVFTSTGTIDTATSGTLTLATNVSGVGGLTKSGSGTLTLSGSNSYSGNTTVSAGRLQVATPDALSTGTLALNGGTFSATGTTGLTIPNALSVSADSALGHATNNGALTFNGNVDLTGGVRTVTLNSPVTLAGAIGNGGLTKTGASTLTLSASNSIPGGITVASGRLQIANPGALGLGTLALTGGTLCSADSTAYSIGNPLSISGSFGLGDAANNGALTFNGNVDLTGGVRSLAINSPVTMAGVISNGGLSKSGSGMLTLNGSNTYTGVTTISQGALNIAGVFALPNWNVPDSLVVSSSATLSVANAFADGDIATLIGTGSNFRAGSAIGLDTSAGDRTYASMLANSPQGALGLSKLGANTLILTASNSYTGATTIASGTLQVGDGISEASIASTSGITNNGALVYAVLGSQTLFGPITGTGSVTKVGAGVLDLHANQPFSGGLVIKQGTVSTTYGYSQGLGSGTVTLGDTSGSAGATLSVNPGGSGTTTYVNPIVVQAGSTGTLVISTTNSSFTLSGPVALNNDLTLNCQYQRIMTLPGVITGSSTLTIQGYNSYSAVSLIGPNGSNFTGNVVVSSGNLAFGNHGLGDGSGTISLAGGILDFLPGTTQDIGSRLRTIGTTALQLAMGGNAVVFGSSLTDASLTKGLTVAGGGSLTLTGSNTYTGTTTVGSTGFGSASAAGLLKLADGGASIHSGNALTTLASGTFDLNSNSQTLGLLNNAGTVTNSGTGVPTLTIGNGSTGAGALTGAMNVVWNQGATSSTYSGNIANAGDLTLNAAGVGAITLSASNSCSGNTFISAGTINVNGVNGSLLNTGTIAISNAATMTIGDASNALANRINDSANLTLGCGNFTLTGKTSTATAETIGTLSIAAGGQSTVTSNIGTGSTAVLTFTGTNVVRSGTGGTVAFAGTGTIMMPNGILTNNILGGWASMGNVIANVSGAPATLVGGTVAALTSFEKTYTAATTTGVNDWTDSQNILLDTSTPVANVSVTLGASLSANSLTLRTSKTPTVNLGGNTLTLTSGGIFLPNTGLAINSTISSGTLTAGNGSAPAELFITNNQGNAASQTTISAAITDNNGNAVSVVKGGDYRQNSLLLSGSNTYTGGTYINGGFVAINNDSNLGGASGAVTFAPNSQASLTYPVGLQVRTSGTLNASRNLITMGSTTTLDTNYSASAGNIVTVAGKVTGNGAFIKNGVVGGGGGTQSSDTGPLAGTLILTNTGNDWAGATTVAAGILQIGDGVTTNGSIPDRPVSLAGANTTLKFANPDAFTFNSLISGTGNLIKTGAGTLTLGVSNSYLNGTTISGGILAIASDASLGAAYDGTISGATVTSVGNAYLSGGAYTSWELTFSAPPSGPVATGTATSGYLFSSGGAITKVTALAGGSGYVAPPTVAVGGSGTGGAVQAYVKGLLTLDGGTLQTTAGISSARAIYITSNSGTVDTNGFDSTLSGIVNGPGALTKTGAGTLTLSGSNTHSGGTTVSSGTLQIANASALGTGGLTVNGGTLDLAGNSVNVGALSGAGGTITTNVSGTSALTTAVSGTSTYAGNIVNGAGSMTLTKEGTGKLVLSGSIGMAGLNANNGVVELAQSGSIGTVSVSATGALTITAHTGAYKVLDTGSLSISSGGSIDLWNNAMVLRASGTTENASNLVAMKAAVNAASNGLQWNGTGIGSTTAFNEAQPGKTQALAVMVYDNTVIKQSSFEGVSGLGYFDGSNSPVGFNQVLVKLTYLGDFNADGLVNASDYTWLDGFALGANTLGDLNGDGVVNATDYTWLDGSALNQSFGLLAGQQSGSGVSPVASSVPAAPVGIGSASPESVPEPGLLGFLITGTLGLLGFRRNRGSSVNSDRRA